MHNNIKKLPDYELEIPLLDIFLIQGNCLLRIPDKFILGVKEGRVLDFEHNNIASLPPSLKQLTKLCMLNLCGNEYLLDISTLGHLKSLEILILSYTGIEKIPLEIGDLVNLRRLEVKGCLRLSHIAPGVMSKLRWLEELHIAPYPAEDRNNESLVEIGKLSMLTFLDLHVPHMPPIPIEGVSFTKLKGFVIKIGGHRQIYYAAEVVHKKTLILGMEYLDTRSMLQVKELIKLSDGIILESVVNPNNTNLLSLVDSSSDEELGGENTKKQFFSKLEHLFLSGLKKLRVLWKCPDQYISLKNLVTLNISVCQKLVKLFTVSVARGLVNMQTLSIQNCSSLVAVIFDGGDEQTGTCQYENFINTLNIDIVFRRLAKIELRELESLNSFYAGMVNIKFPSLEFVGIYGCNMMDKWGDNVTYDTPILKHVEQGHFSYSMALSHADARFNIENLAYQHDVIQATITGLSPEI